MRKRVWDRVGVPRCAPGAERAGVKGLGAGRPRGPQGGQATVCRAVAIGGKPRAKACGGEGGSQTVFEQRLLAIKGMNRMDAAVSGMCVMREATTREQGDSVCPCRSKYQGGIESRAFGQDTSSMSKQACIRGKRAG